MNRDEAKAILRVHRPSQSASNDPELARALDYLRDDPELARWWKEEADFDQVVTEKLGSVPPPADLRGKILSGAASPPTDAETASTSNAGGSDISRPIADTESSAIRPPWWRTVPALAAALAILLGAIGVVIWNRQQPPQSGPALAEWQTGSLTELNQVLSGTKKLDVESASSADLRRWLEQAHAPNPAALPESLTRANSVGCKTVVFGNQKVSIICFHASPTQLAHLVTVEERTLSNPPPEHRPQFVRQGDWVTASWSDQGQSFMLAMKASEEELRRLLSPAA